MNDKPGDLKLRTKDFALRIIRMYCALPKSTEAQVLGKQVLRSGTSVGAHYREAGLQELEETGYWLSFSVKAVLLIQKICPA